MTISRRAVISGATSVSVLAIAACTSPPAPAPSPTGSPAPALGRPAAIVRSSWSSDPFSQGSTSFLPVGSTSAYRARLAESIGDRVFFAGEATSVVAPNELEGARQSGVRAAQDIQRVATDGERIAIIGAGMAGAACAHALRSEGLTVIVIEARERVGGRVLTVDRPDWPLAIEVGGMRVAVDSTLRDELAEAGLTITPADTTVRLDAAGDPIDDARLRGVLQRAASAADRYAFDVPLSTALAALEPLGTDSAPGALSEAEAAAAAVSELVGGRAGALARQLSAQHGLDEIPPGWNAVVVGGVQQQLAALLEGMDVILASPVTTMLHDDDGVAIRLATGESLSVDRAVVTVPLAVLKDDGIVFEPPLPPLHREAIASLGVGTLETVVLRFDEATWPHTAAVWLTDPTAGLLVSEWINLQVIADAPVLVGLIGPENAVRYERLSDDDLIDVLMSELAPYLTRE